MRKIALQMKRHPNCWEKKWSSTFVVWHSFSLTLLSSVALHWRQSKIVCFFSFIYRSDNFDFCSFFQHTNQTSCRLLRAHSRKSEKSLFSRNKKNKKKKNWKKSTKGQLPCESNYCGWRRVPRDLSKQHCSSFRWSPMQLTRTFSATATVNFFNGTHARAPVLLVSFWSLIKAIKVGQNQIAEWSACSVQKQKKKFYRKPTKLCHSILKTPKSNYKLNQNHLQINSYRTKTLPKR